MRFYGTMERIESGGLRADITGARCSLHSCRHTFAKNYLLNGGDIFSVQRILGHSSLASVRIYQNFFAPDIKRQHRQFSPVGNTVENPALYPFLYATARQ
jgi:integrase/recombinase XerD